METEIEHVLFSNNPQEPIYKTISFISFHSVKYNEHNISIVKEATLTYQTRPSYFPLPASYDVLELVRFLPFVSCRMVALLGIPKEKSIKKLTGNITQPDSTLTSILQHPTSFPFRFFIAVTALSRFSKCTNA